MSDALYTYWVGMDIPADTSAADVAAFNDFYSNVHKAEVLAGNPGFLRGRRYELRKTTRAARVGHALSRLTISKAKRQRNSISVAMMGQSVGGLCTATALRLGKSAALSGV